MTEQEVLDLINDYIITNGNNEITANVLRPILEEMLSQPNLLIGLLLDLNTSDTTNIVNAINSIVSINIPNKTVIFPLDTTGIDFNQGELQWVRDAVNSTATNNGSFVVQNGNQMVFSVDVLLTTVGGVSTIQKDFID